MWRKKSAEHAVYSFYYIGISDGIDVIWKTWNKCQRIQGDSGLLELLFRNLNYCQHVNTFDLLNLLNSNIIIFQIYFFMSIYCNIFDLSNGFSIFSFNMKMAAPFVDNPFLCLLHFMQFIHVLLILHVCYHTFIKCDNKLFHQISHH